MPTFTPPTQHQAIGTGLWAYVGTDVGQSVVRIDGTFTEHPYPSGDELAPLAEGTDFFLGGRTYYVSDDLAAALEADGFTVTPDLAYGESGYGSGGYGG